MHKSQLLTIQDLVLMILVTSNSEKRTIGKTGPMRSHACVVKCRLGLASLPIAASRCTRPKQEQRLARLWGTIMNLSTLISPDNGVMAENGLNCPTSVTLRPTNDSH